jgi:hypothetical protein
VADSFVSVASPPHPKRAENDGIDGERRKAIKSKQENKGGKFNGNFV